MVWHHGKPSFYTTQLYGLIVGGVTGILEYLLFAAEE
jgi:hypothetical protein